MTYNDPDRTMTQYKIDLTFQELEPITEDDYGNFDAIVGTEDFLLRPTIENEVAIPDNQIGF
jgi:hypothetical protein